jgi:hypothetical protein
MATLIPLIADVGSSARQDIIFASAFRYFPCIGNLFGVVTVNRDENASPCESALISLGLIFGNTCTDKRASDPAYDAAHT